MIIINDEQVKNFETFLKQHKFFFIAGHKEPDGDAIYSCLGMAAILKSKGLEYQLLSAGPFKRVEIREKEPLFTNTPAFLSQEDRKNTGLIMLDCSEMSRLGELDGDLTDIDTFIVDHHKTAEPTGNSIIDPSSPACACLVQQLYEKIIGKPDPETAKNLFTGMATDTGYFRFLKEDSAEVFKSTARLVESGANPRTTYDFITGGKSFNTRKLLGIMLSRAEQYYNNKLIITWETQEDTKKYGQDGRDNDALYSLLLACEDVEAVVFIRQDTDHTCTCGFRSRDKVDVSAIAAKFGGGGHKNAAGLSTDGKLENLKPAILKEFAKVL